MTVAYTGFGCPVAMDPHHFKVVIPAGRSDDVLIVEDFGLAGGSNGVPEQVERCRLRRGIWTAMAATVKQAFNERLKEKQIPLGRWNTGDNRVDRLLGKELCVLAWAVETVSEDMVPNGLRNWLALNPEARWWLFSKAAAGTGTVDHVDLGWRKAIRVALTEVSGETAAMVSSRKRVGKQQPAVQTSLFELMGRSGDEP